MIRREREREEVGKRTDFYFYFLWYSLESFNTITFVLNLISYDTRHGGWVEDEDDKNDNMPNPNDDGL